MNLVVITALIAVCGAAKLDRTYLPPSSAVSAGGSPGSLQAPLTRSSEQGQDTSGLPTGSYTNNFGGVVVDAAAPGTRASADSDLSGLGGPRPSYGSTDSKVGDAAFRGSVAGFRNTPSFGTASSQFNGQQHNFASSGQIDTHGGQFSSNGQENNGHVGSHAGQFPSNGFSGQGFQGFENMSERPQAAKDRNSNILTLSNDVNSNSYSYGFETDNGIAVGENGVAVNGVQAEGGYSYQGDDGQMYKVIYTADEGGYRPQGAHLPTPPPIPDEILKSLEQNAKDEAAGLVDDGSYDAQKYNTDGDYTHDNGGNIQYNGAQLSQFGKRPESDATVSGSFINQNGGQQFEKPGSGNFGAGLNVDNQHSSFNGQSSQGVGSGQFGIAGQGQFGTGSNVQNQFHGQFNQENQRPQFGAAGSSNTHSTIGQSGQGNANHFGTDAASVQHSDSSQSSFSSQPLSGHQDNTGNALGQDTGHPFGSQFNQQTSNPNSALNSQSDHPQFGSSFKPQGSEAFSGASLNKDQDKQDFGKPFPETFSGPNYNRPSAGNFNSNRPGQANKFGSAGNRFLQSSGQFGARNEYLPPASANGQPQPERLNSPSGFNTVNSGSPNSGFISNVGEEQKTKDQVPDFLAVNRPNAGVSSASASASVGQPAFQPQPAKPFNAFDSTKLQFNSNKYNQQETTQNQQVNQFSSQNSVNQQQSLIAQMGPDFASKPTSVPETELTTPLEPNETPTSQGSQFPSQTTASFSTFDSKPSSNNQASAQFGFQGNTNFGQQSSSQTLSPSFPTSAPQSTISQFSTASTQSGFQTISSASQNSNGKPQFPQNSFVQKEPAFNQGVDNSYYYNQPPKPFSTPVRPHGSRFPSSPSYQSNGLAAQNQYYNQQSFQSSTKFPASPSLASVSPTSPTQFTQNQGYNGITQAAISPFPSASPTPASQFGLTQNNQFGSRPTFNQQTSFGNQAQPSKPVVSQQSTFTSTSQQNRPTFPQQAQSTFPSRPVNQFGQKPITSVPQTQAQTGGDEKQPTDASSQQQSTMTQQYQGTIYEYNKPAEILPAPTETDSSSSQTIESGVSSESNPTSEQSQKNKPLFGNGATSTQFGQHSQLSSKQPSQQTEIQFGSQPSKPINPLISNTQFGHTAQSSTQPEQSFGASVSSQFGQTQSASDGTNSLQQTAQGVQIGAFKPFNNAAAVYGGSLGSKPQFGSQTTQSFTQSTQSFGSSQTSQPTRGPTQSQFNSQTFGNAATGQDSGYFYPGNPKPQFQGGEISKNQFNQNAQSGRPQSGSNQFSLNSQNANNQFGQNSQSNSLPTGSFNQQSSQSSYNVASKPQFGAQSQTQYNQNLQTQFGQKVSNSPSQPIGQPNQSTASSHAVAFGQASASASASTLPQQTQYKPFGQNKPQLLTPDQDQNGQGSETQEPSGINPSGALNSNTFGANAQSAEATKPLFNSACCKGPKDSTPAKSTDKPSQAFQGTQSFNGQNFAGQGEVFGGPRQPPSFDAQTGYHY